MPHTDSTTPVLSSDPATLKNICVYCGSSGRVSDLYKQAATRMGEILGQQGRTLVYGGGAVGLMGLVAGATLEQGGQVIGIIPAHIEKREIGHPDLTELHVVASMHERKQMMVDRSDAFVILPGGLGTMDEFFEIMTWRQLGLHDKPIIVVNVGEYWTPLLHLIDIMVKEGFVRAADRDILRVVDSVEDVLVALENADPENFDPRTRLM
jgi:uncharacterized protein (TIGR00730 family)